MKIAIALGVVVLVSSHSILGWVLPLYNTTPYSALVGVEYPLCRTDVVVVLPGGTVNVDAKECLVTDIKVALGEIRQIKTPVGVMNVPTNVVQTIHWKVPGHRDFSATIAKQANGKYDINATYGTQLPQRVIQAVDTKVIQPLQEHVIKPIDRTVIQPIERNVIQPINQNVVQPVVAIGQTFGHVISMATLINDMIPPVIQTIDHISKQISIVSAIKNGKELVDPLFSTVEQLASLPPYFQAILNKLVESMASIEVIVRPSSPSDADKIRDTAITVESVSAAVDEITKKIQELNHIVHPRVKNMAESADHITSEILAIVK